MEKISESGKEEGKKRESERKRERERHSKGSQVNVTRSADEQVSRW